MELSEGGDELTEKCVSLGWASRCVMSFGWDGVLQVPQVFFAYEKMKPTLS